MNSSVNSMKLMVKEIGIMPGHGGPHWVKRVAVVCAAVVGAVFLATHSPASESAAKRLWTAQYNGPGNDIDQANALGVSPDGATVFVAGRSWGGRSLSDYATIAYDASTGARLWIARYNGPANSHDGANSLRVSPDGTTVFVTGGSYGSGTSSDYSTIAYDAVTGATLWTARYNGPGNGGDVAYDLAVSPDGATVFVTGGSLGSGTNFDYATIAYEAATGVRLWTARYNGSGNGSDQAASLRVSPDGTTVFVTGGSGGADGFPDYATIAYEAATGVRLWAARYHGPANISDQATALRVSPDGTKVFVTGESYGYESFIDYATIAYDAKTGVKLWTARYNGPGKIDDFALSLGVSPDGARVFVTGGSGGFQTRRDYATIAYDAATGARLWTARYDGPASDSDSARDLVVSPDGSTVFVTGEAYGVGTVTDYTTIAYDATTGAMLWKARYDGPVHAWDDASSLGVSPDGRTVFVTGQSIGTGPGENFDYATIAYRP